MTTDTPEDVKSNECETHLSSQTFSKVDESDLSSSDQDSTCSSIEINVSKTLKPRKEETLEDTTIQSSSLQEGHRPLSTDGSKGMVGKTSEKEKCTSKQFPFSAGPPTISIELDRQRQAGVSIEDNRPQDTDIGEINNRLLDNEDSNQGSCSSGSTSSTRKEKQKEDG